MALLPRLVVAQRPGQPLEIVCARLRDWGCELHDCSSQGEALAALRGELADIVLIDAWIDGGMALLTRIKADPRTRYLPVVIAAPGDAAAGGAHSPPPGAAAVVG